MQRTSVPEGWPMGLTYTTAAQRDVQRTQRRTQHSAERFQPARLSLVVTSGVALLAIALAYFGRISVLEQWESARAGVRRVSLGPWPMMAAMRVIGQAAAAVAASNQYGTFLQPKA